MRRASLTRRRSGPDGYHIGAHAHGEKFAVSSRTNSLSWSVGDSAPAGVSLSTVTALAQEMVNQWSSVHPGSFPQAPTGQGSLQIVFAEDDKRATDTDGDGLCDTGCEGGRTGPAKMLLDIDELWQFSGTPSASVPYNQRRSDIQSQLVNPFGQVAVWSAMAAYQKHTPQLDNVFKAAMDNAFSLIDDATSSRAVEFTRRFDVPVASTACQYAWRMGADLPVISPQQGAGAGTSVGRGACCAGMQESPRSVFALLASSVVLALSVWLGSPLGAHAQVAPAFFCPVDPLVYPEKCEKLARRQERRAAIELYPGQHPLRVSALAQGDAFMLGLGNLYVAGFWGIAAGVSLVYEVAPPWALRFDLLGRFGHGHLSSWSVDSPGPIDTTAGFVGGMEARGALFRRMRAMYFGGTAALGYLHLKKQKLHEQDFDDESDAFDHDFGKTARVPRNAAYLAAGFILGGELTPGGRVGFNVHLTPGVWNDFRHFYLDLALVMTVKLWD